MVLLFEQIENYIKNATELNKLTTVKSKIYGNRVIAVVDDRTFAIDVKMEHVLALPRYIKTELDAELHFDSLDSAFAQGEIAGIAKKSNELILGLGGITKEEFDSKINSIEQKIIGIKQSVKETA